MSTDKTPTVGEAVEYLARQAIARENEWRKQYCYRGAIISNKMICQEFKHFHVFEDFAMKHEVLWKRHNAQHIEIL